MNKKKKLPKAIVTPIEGAAKPDAKIAAGPARIPDNVIEMVPKESATKADGPSPAAPAQAPRAGDAGEIAKRKRQARRIVERHANLSAVGGVIPLPVVNIAGVTAILVHMVRRLCRLYGVPYEGNRARAVVIALMGGTMPTGLATAAATTLVWFVPGTNMIGLAVSSVTASATARSIGRLMVQHFEDGATLANFPALGGR